MISQHSPNSLQEGLL